jgi:glycosyltransferase involved in cell wall biosynthesis
MEAFARYRALDPSSTLQLRMVGVSHEGEAVSALMKRFELPAKSIVIEPFLSEPVLQQLYRNAVCVIVPSLMEGFGIPVLEAMASGTPLLCSNTWSLPEVGGDAALYFDPTNVEEMAQALFHVCTDMELRNRLTEWGLARAEVFHPDRIHAQVMELWRELPKLHRSWKANEAT